MHEYLDKNRVGDHICSISDLGKMQAHYPAWPVTKSLDDIFKEMFESWQMRQDPVDK
jgi:CDP-paratose 2-epimerase